MPLITTLSTFKDIYDARFNNLVIYSVGMGVPYEQAKDIVQEAFIRLWEERNKIDNPSSWLFTVVRNKSLNWLTSSKNNTSKKVELSDNTLKPVDETAIEEAIEYFRQVEQAYKKIQQLSSRCKDIFVMSYIEHMKVKEIAQELNISENTVKTYLKRAKELLQVIVLILTGVISLLFSA
jgi:RNA polymerase sigma-70 factor (ECF subfamily)